MTIIKIEGNLAQICAWCPDKLETDQKCIEDGYDLSHGICDKCSKRVFKS